MRKDTILRLADSMPAEDDDNFIVATGVINTYQKFRVVWSPHPSKTEAELKIELLEGKNALYEEVWFPFSRWYSRPKIKLLEVDYKLLEKAKREIYSHLLYSLIDVYDSEKLRSFPFKPFEIYGKEYLGSWRIVCTGINQFSWDDVVENSAGEKVFVKRSNTNSSETNQLEDACIFFLKKIREREQKKLDVSA